MESSSDPVKVLKGELRRVELFYSFWDRRIDIESHYIQALEGLIFSVPGPAGSLKDALDALNALVRIEIDQRTVSLGVLRDLRENQEDGPSPSKGWEYTSNWLTSAANDLQQRIIDLAKQKAALISLEESAEKSTLTRTEEVVNQSNDNPSTMSRRLFGKRRDRPSTSLVTLSPSFTQFDQADQQYRNSVVCFNYWKRLHLREFMQKAEEWVTDEFDSAAMIQKMISAFANGQSDLAGALNRGSSQCRLMANQISPSTESNDFIDQVKNGISAEFGQPHLYKNFWFGLGEDGRLSTILFGRPIPKSNSKNTTLMRVFEVLLESDPLLSFGPSQDLSEEDSEQLSKSAHDLETYWEAQKTDGGSEVRRLLTTQPVCRKLLLHFLIHMPEPLMDLSRSELFYDGSIGGLLTFLCYKSNGGSYFQRKMLSTVVRLLADSSKDDRGVQWVWWDQDERGKLWSRVLTGRADTMMFIFPLWIHCVEYLETDEFVLLRAKLDRLQKNWKEWVGDRSSSFTIFPFPW